MERNGNWNKWRILARVSLVVMLAWSCQQGNEVKISDAQLKVKSESAAVNNAQIITATQEVMDVTGDALLQNGITYGRAAQPSLSFGHGGHDQSGSNDDDNDSGDDNNGGDDHEGPFSCKPSITGSFNLDQSKQDTLIYSGTVSIDFGDGSSCADSTHVRTGKITDTFELMVIHGDSVTFSSTETITFEAYGKDTVKLDGTFITKSASGEPTVLDIQDAKITYPDGTATTWHGQLTYLKDEGAGKWNRSGTKQVNGSLEGTTRDGLAYTAEITQTLVFDYTCSFKRIPVSGTIDLTVAGQLSTIDYGDGTCDKTYTVTINGDTTEHQVGE